MSGGGGGGILKTLVLTGVSFLLPGSAAFAPALFAKRFVVTYALGLLSKATAPKFSTPAEALNQQTSADITSNNPIQTWKIPYGECITGGTLVYAEVDASDSNWLNMVVAYSPVQINRYLDIFVNEDLVYSNRSSDPYGTLRLKTSRYCSSEDYFPNVLYQENTHTDDTISVPAGCHYHVSFAVVGGTFSFDGTSQSHQDNVNSQTFGVGVRYNYINRNTTSSAKTVSLTFQEDRNVSEYNGYKYYAFVFQTPMNQDALDDYDGLFFPILYDGSHDSDDDTQATIPNINNLRGDTPYHSDWGIPISDYYLRDITTTDNDSYPQDNPNFWWNNTGYAAHRYHTFSDGSKLPNESRYAQTGTDVGVSGGTDPALYDQIAFGHFIIKKDDIYQGQMPNISVVVQGKKLKDTRGPTDSIEYSQNPAWVLRDYLTNTEYGCAIPEEEIDDASFEDVANLCDEELTFDGTPGLSGSLAFTGQDLDANRSDWMNLQVNSTLGGRALRSPSGFKMLPFDKDDLVRVRGYATSSSTQIEGDTGYVTKIGKIIDGGRGCLVGSNDDTLEQCFVGYKRKRYRLNGLVDTGNSKKSNIDNILSSMAAKLLWEGGKYILIGGEYRSGLGGATGEINEKDIIGNLTLTHRSSQRDSFNRIKAVFNSKNLGYIPTDVQLVDNGGIYVTEDNGEESTADLQLPLVTNLGQAQALARIALMRQRFGRTIIMKCNLSVFRFRVGDTVYVSTNKLDNSSPSLQNVPWEIMSMKMTIGSNPDVDVVLQETSSTIWADVY